MNRYTITRATTTRIYCGSQVAFTEGRRVKFGKVIRVDHDHYKIACADGSTRRILHEKVEALTAPADEE